MKSKYYCKNIFMENKHGVKISQTIFIRMNYLDYG